MANTKRSSAIPNHLYNYARFEHHVHKDYRDAAAHVHAALERFATSCTEYRPGDMSDLANRLNLFADRCHSLGQWTNEVGNGFAQADRRAIVAYGRKLGRPLIMARRLKRPRIMGKAAIGDWLRKARKRANDAIESGRELARVRWWDALDTTGLHGDWLALYNVWFFETSPTTLGTWSISKEGNPLVTITSPDYINDLKAKPHHQQVRGAFMEKFPDISTIKPGDKFPADGNDKEYDTARAPFTGTGTTTGDYNALEWFLGSYATSMEVTSVDPVTKTIKVRVVVNNKSHWQSGTRVPQSFRNRGFPDYLIPNSRRSDPGPGGTFEQDFVWEETIQY